MNSFGKKILIAGIIAVAGFAFIGYDKYQNLKAIFDKMTIKPYGLPRKVKASISEIAFEIDFILQNPTGEDFAVTGYFATLTQISVYYKGNYIGSAYVDIDEVSVPAHDRMILHDIQIVIPTSAILSSVSDLLPQLENLSSSSLSDLQFTGIVNVAGSNFKIGQDGIS